MQGVGVLGGSATKGDKEVTMQYLELKGGDRGACKLLGDVIEVLGCLLEGIYYGPLDGDPCEATKSDVIG
ncbi:hypothetical protein Tco_0497005 [Tanacetum coccineum]